jgi:hypothetical protein
LKSFLQETAEDLVEKYGKDISSLELIFPNKRTDFHFKKSLSNALGKTSWSPQTYTIQQYAGILTGLKALDKISLLFELYHSFKKSDNQFNYDFDSFHKLGEIILHDFNEIDNYLVDPKQIFTNIKNIHEIDQKYASLTEEQIKIIKQYWINFSFDKKSKEKEQFLLLWNILPAVYQNFSENLLSKSLAYEGLIYKQVADLVAKNELKDTGKIKIFIGFNALNKAQKKLFKFLKNKQIASFYWDNDSYYHHNPIQEAGDFLRKNYEVLAEDSDAVPGNFKAFNKSVSLIGIPGKVGQAKAIPQILKLMCNDDGKLTDPEKTVVVLPDENMLFPVLSSMPDFIGRLNITMGYPLKNTPLYGLLIYFLKIQKAINQKDMVSPRIYHKDALSILNHPYLKSEYSEEIARIEDEIKKKQMIYLNPKILLAKKNKLFEELFTPVQSGKAVDSISKLLNVLFLLFTGRAERDSGEKSLVDEYIYQTYIDIKRLHEVLQKEDKHFELSFNIVLQFVKQVLNNVRITFESESTDGLQIMGLIETRNIDFENVILLNANEGILPNLSRPPSLISESMRHAFELPVLKYQDSIFAYFFYRLLQRAKRIFILYDNLGNNSRSGELSRFVYQLELESGFEITRMQLIQNVKLINNQKINIKKTQAVLEKMKQFVMENDNSKRQLTASSLDVYQNCPFQFYLKYIAGIKEPEKVEEEFSPVEMGIIIHAAMEYLFRGIVEKKGSKIIEKQDFKLIYANVDDQLRNAFLAHLKIEDKEDFEYTGNLLIIKEVVKKYLNYILKFDEQRAPFQIVQMENKELFKSSIEIELKEEKLNIAIRGIIDRIDRIGNDLYVVDYKTGKAEKEFASLEELFLNESNKRKKAISQVLLYTLLVRSNTEFSSCNILPAIYDIKNMYKKDFDPFIKFKSDKEKFNLRNHLLINLLADYEQLLKALISEIFDPEIDFSQTPIADNCKFCSYRAICAKES